MKVTNSMIAKIYVLWGKFIKTADLPYFSNPQPDNQKVKRIEETKIVSTVLVQMVQ